MSCVCLEVLKRFLEVHQAMKNNMQKQNNYHVTTPMLFAFSLDSHPDAGCAGRVS